jgi:hypothetical protein
MILCALQHPPATPSRLSPYSSTITQLSKQLCHAHIANQIPGTHRRVVDAATDLCIDALALVDGRHELCGVIFDNPDGAVDN